MDAAYQDQFYLDEVRPDEQKFIDFENIVFSIGQDVMVIEEGKGTNGNGS